MNLAGATLGSSILSGAAGMFGAAKTAKMQKQIAEMNAREQALNRQMQIDLFNKQMDWNKEQFNLTNEWNSASAQRSRLEEAGLNPNLMMNGGSAGQASSMSAPSAPSLEAPQINGQGMLGAAQLKQNAMQQFFSPQAMQAMSEAIGTNIDNMSRAARNLADINKTNAETSNFKVNMGYTNSLREAQNLLNAHNEQLYPMLRYGQQKQNEAIEYDIERKNLENGMLFKFSNRFPEYIDNKLRDMNAKINLQIANTKEINEMLPYKKRLTNSQIRLNLANTVKSGLESDGLRISNRVARETADDMIYNSHLSKDMNTLEYNLNSTNYYKPTYLQNYEFEELGGQKNFSKNFAKYNAIKDRISKNPKNPNFVAKEQSQALHDAGFTSRQIDLMDRLSRQQTFRGVGSFTPDISFGQALGFLKGIMK